MIGVPIFKNRCMRPLTSSFSHLHALDLAIPAKKSIQESKVIAEPEESKEWNKGLSLNEQCRIYTIARRHAIQEKLYEKLKEKYEDISLLTEKEFRTVDQFRGEISDELNGKLRRGDSSPDVIREEETINRGLQKLVNQGCMSHKLTFRGFNSSVLQKLNKAGEDIQEGKIFIDPGILFSSPYKYRALTHARKKDDATEDATKDVDAPGMLLHLVGNKGAHSPNPPYEYCVLYPSKARFDAALKGFDQNDYVYKLLLVQQSLEKEHGRLPFDYGVITPSSGNYMQELYKIAFTLDQNGKAQSAKNRFQANLAIAMQRMSPYSLRKLIKEHVNPAEHKKFEQDFPRSYEKSKEAILIYDLLIQEIRALLPEEMEKMLMREIAEIAQSPERLFLFMSPQVINEAIGYLMQKNGLPSSIKESLRSLEDQYKSRQYKGVIGYKSLDLFFDRNFSERKSTARDSLEVARDLLKSGLRKTAVSREHYFEIKVDSLVAKCRDQKILKGGERERTALLEKIAHLFRPITPHELTEIVWPHIAPDNLDALNTFLEKELAIDRQALLQRQLDRLPRNAKTDWLRQRFSSSEREPEMPEVPAQNKEEAIHHLRMLKEEIDQLPPAPDRIRSSPGRLQPAKKMGISASSMKRSPSMLEKNYPDATRVVMARIRAIEENVSTGKIYADAAKIGIAAERIDHMLAKEIPLAFPDKTVYRQFLQELQEVLAQCGLEDSIISAGGTATNFYSKNPRKPVNWHFDTPQSEKKSDLDLFITGQGFLEIMRKEHAYSYSPKDFSPPINQRAAEQLPEHLYPSAEVMKHLPKLREFAKRWEKELGREITFVGLSEGINTTVREFMLSEPF